MSAERTIYGVWECLWDTNELIGLYWTRDEAETKAKSGGVYTSPDYKGVQKWEVEEHSIPWPPPERDALVKAATEACEAEFTSERLAAMNRLRDVLGLGEGRA